MGETRMKPIFRTHGRRTAVSFCGLAASTAAFILLLAPLSPASAGRCGNAYDIVAGKVGKVTVKVEKGSAASAALVSKSDSVAFDRNLQSIIDVILSAPHLKPPVGADVDGFLRGEPSPHCKKEPCKGIPVAGSGMISFFYFLDIDGKPTRVRETSIDLNISLNNLEAAVAPAGGVTDLDGREIFSQMRKSGQIGGAPVYRDDGRGAAVIVMARTDKPWSRPVSREAFLKAAIRDLEKDVAATGPVSNAPKADLFRKWLSERPMREKEARKMFDEMRRQDPSVAESIRKSTEQAEAEVEAKFRKEAEGETAKAARDAKKGGKAKVLGMADVLLRHRTVLAAMSPADRASQAVYLKSDDPLDPPLAPVDADDGLPHLVTVDLGFFDPSLPRTALQFVTVRVGTRDIDPPDPDECDDGNPARPLLRKTLLNTPWGAIRALSTPSASVGALLR